MRRIKKIEGSRDFFINRLFDIRLCLSSITFLDISLIILNTVQLIFSPKMQKRKTLDKIPIQANFYPLPSMAFLQDKSTRLTLLSAQSNGVAGLHEGIAVWGSFFPHSLRTKRTFIIYRLRGFGGFFLGLVFRGDGRVSRRQQSIKWNCKKMDC